MLMHCKCCAIDNLLGVAIFACDKVNNIGASAMNAFSVGVNYVGNKAFGEW